MMAFLRRVFARGEAALSEARPRDAAALAKLHAGAFRRGWSEEEFARLLLERNVLAHRAMLGPELAGFIISRRAADEAEILSVAVEPRRRGRGLASRLLTLHLRRLAAFGVRAVLLELEETNEPARRLYARAGFHEVGRRPGYYPRDEFAAAALVLRRDLA
jgi:ribosomal-protein-alanine N-acetyltransferase